MGKADKQKKTKQDQGFDSVTATIGQFTITLKQSAQCVLELKSARRRK